MSQQRTPTQKLQHTINRDAALAALYLGDKLNKMQAMQAEQTRLQAVQTQLALEQWWNSLTPAQQHAETVKAEQQKLKAEQQKCAQESLAAVGRYENAKRSAHSFYKLAVWVWSIIFGCAFVLTAGAETRQDGSINWGGAAGPIMIELFVYLVFRYRAKDRRDRRLKAAEEINPSGPAPVTTATATATAQASQASQAARPQLTPHRASLVAPVLQLPPATSGADPVHETSPPDEPTSRSTPSNLASGATPGLREIEEANAAFLEQIRALLPNLDALDIGLVSIGQIEALEQVLFGRDYLLQPQLRTEKLDSMAQQLRSQVKGPAADVPPELLTLAVWTKVRGAVALAQGSTPIEWE
jgi:hypothetical protein